MRLSAAHLFSAEPHHVPQNPRQRLRESVPMGRADIRAKTARASTSTTSVASKPSKLSANTKKSKLATKHASFVSRIEKKSATSSASTKRSRRRNKASTLISGLESLADALPSDPINDAVNFTSMSSQARPGQGVGIGKKSIKSRPGAMKRKEKIVKSECERFGKNLAIMTALEEKAAPATAAPENPLEKKAPMNGTWAALRGFIQATMEVKEEFVKKPAEGAMEVEA